MRAPSEHRQLGLPVFIVYGGVATAVDLVVSAGISRAAGGWDGFAVFAVVFVVIAVAAMVCADWILQRATRARGKGAAQ